MTGWKVTNIHPDLTSSSLTPVNGHVQCQFSRKTGKWSAPAFIENPFLRVHGLAPVFNYGTVLSPHNTEAWKLTLYRTGGLRRIERYTWHTRPIAHSTCQFQPRQEILTEMME
jgi:branched-chain amino acid aminotransferase